MSSPFDDHSYTTLTDELPEYDFNSQMPSAVPESPELESNKKRKGGNFKKNEDLILVSGWLNVSKDATRGNSQKGTTFWDRIFLYVQENGITNRSIPSLKARWNDINRGCSKFAGWLAQVERRPQSGTTTQTRFSDTKESYKAIIGSNFLYEHCWEILKNEPKWTNSITDKRQKKHSNDSPSSNSTTPDWVDADDVNQSRPMGQKAAKQLQNKGKEKEGDCSAASVLKDYLDQKNKAHNELLARHEIECKIKQELIALEKEKIAAQKEQIAAQKEQEDERILQLDMSKLNPNLQEYYYNKQMEILRKRTMNM